MRDWMVQRRKRAGYTQTQLAEALEVGQAAISSWETGRSTHLPLRTLERLSKAFHVSLGEIVEAELNYQNSVA